MAAARGLGGPAARRAPPTPCSRPPSAPTRSRSARASAAATARAQLVRVLLERLELPVVRRRRRALGARAVRARRADRAHAAQRRARAPARRDGRGGRRAPARTRCAARPRSTAPSCCSRAPTRSSPRRATGVLVAGYGQPSLATAGTRRRAHRRDRRVPRQGARAAARRGRGARSRTASRRGSSSRRSGSSRATCCRRSSARSAATAGSGRRCSSRAQRDHDRPRRACGATRGGCCDALGGAELWAVVKANGYGHGAADCARAALDGGATALCVATVAEALALRRELPDARILVMGPADATSPRRARRGSSSCVSGRRPRGRPGAREARHRHGPLGPLRAGRARRATSSA